MHFSVASFIKTLDRTWYVCESLNGNGSVKANKVHRQYWSTTKHCKIQTRSTNDYV